MLVNIHNFNMKKNIVLIEILLSLELFIVKIFTLAAKGLLTPLRRQY
jgi:hypothetical protein